MDPLVDILQTVYLGIIGVAIRVVAAAAIIGIVIAAVAPFVFGAEFARRIWQWAAGFEAVAGLTWRRGAFYTPVHTWLRRRAQLLRVGFDDIGAHVLRHLDAVTLPDEGATLKPGDAMLTVSSGGRRLDIPAPIGGVVQRVNRRLAADPNAAVRSPYGRGWLLELAPADQRYTGLPSDGKARGWFAQEAGRLSAALEHATGVVAADGGELVMPPHLVMTGEQLDELTHAFLDARPARPAA